MSNNPGDFKKTPLGWKWFLWVVLAIPLTVYIIVSTNQIWPNLFWLSLLSAITVVGCSFYVARHTTDSDINVKKAAIIGATLIEGFLVLNSFIHGAASRNFETAKLAEIEESKKLQESIEATERINKSESERALAQATADKQAANRAEAERRKYLTTGVISNRQSEKQTTLPNRANTIVNESKQNNLENTIIKIDSPAQALSRSFWPVFVGFLLEILTSAASGLAVLWTRLELKDELYASLPSPTNTANFEIQTAPVTAPVEPPPGSLKPPQKTAPKNRPRHYPDAGSDPGTLIKTTEGTFWQVLNRQFPDIPGIRYSGKTKKTVIEVWTEEGKWITQFGKRKLEELDKLDKDLRLSKIRDAINSATIKKSETAFAASSQPR
jgi:hypothetical protein